MLHSARVHTLKDIDCLLSNLGQVNILCGKNNSGKSTILNALSKKEHCDFAYAVLPERVQEAALLIGNDDEEIRFWNRIIASVASSKQFWFATETESLIRAIFDSYRSSEMTVPLDENRVKHGCKGLFGATPSVILVPETRNVTPKSNEKQVKEVDGNGTGLITRLYLDKNKRDESENRLYFNQVRSHFEFITDGIRFEIESEESGSISLIFNQQNNGWVEASACGLGLRQLLILLYHAIYPKHNLVLIEEPELFMHPEMQRRFLYFIKNQSKKSFVLATHSNIFLNPALVDRVYYTSYNGRINLDEASSRAMVLSDLGYSVIDNLLSDLVILTEGPTDIHVVEEFLKKMGLYDRYNIKFWPLGGSVMDQVDLSVFADRYKIIALVDQDPESEDIREEFVGMCAEFNIPVTRLERYAIENYFTIDAIRHAWPTQLKPEHNSVPTDTNLKDYLGFKIKRKNRMIAQAMSLEDIKGTDLEDFLMTIKRMVEN